MQIEKRYVTEFVYDKKYHIADNSSKQSAKKRARIVTN